MKPSFLAGSGLLLWMLVSNTSVVSAADLPSSWTRDNVVRTDGGMISGQAGDGGRVFKGVPYAAPPTGALRWRPPQPVVPWEGVRKATRFAASCAQPPIKKDEVFFDGPYPTREDCLYLNVWTAAASRNERRPVLLWIHDGALLWGESSRPAYDGEVLPQKGLVLVTINYRPGVFGKLSHPKLSRESPNKVSGNYGLLDMVAAIKWAHRNIAAFGGDPERITLFGESVGGRAVSALSTSPLVKGDIHGAIAADTLFSLYSQTDKLADAEQAGVEFVKAAGVDSIGALRKVSTDALIALSSDRLAELSSVAEAGPHSEALRCPDSEAGLVLPAGFCATVFADGIGHARNLVVAPNGVVYVNTWSGFYYGNDTPHEGGFLVGLKDTKRSGKADQVERFGETAKTGGAGGTGIAFYKNYLYAEINDRIVRYALSWDALVPKGMPQTVVSGLPLGGDHPMHPFVIDAKGMLYVDVASVSNSCQERNRQRNSPGMSPCKELETRGGIWRYDANRLGQKFSPAERFAIGIRNADGVAIDGKGAVYATQHGRDSLAQNWPSLYTPEQSAMQPAEELHRIVAHGRYGWPECYYDAAQGRLVQAPEYGGDGGKKVGVCAERRAPIAAFSAHWAPNALLFYQGTQFPGRYREGAFIAFHGSWNRAPFPQGGYNVVFQPLKNGKAVAGCEIFAYGFAGEVRSPDKAKHRPAGLAAGPDGSLYVSDDVSGRIYRITYRGASQGNRTSRPVACPRLDEPPGTPDLSLLAQGTAELPAPPGVSRSTLELGQRLFLGDQAAATCTGCHGLEGKGTVLGPDLTDGQWLWSDGSLTGITKSITEGVSTPKQYREAMPPKGGSQLGSEQVAAIAAYVWALGHGSRMPTEIAIPGARTFPESLTSLIDGTIIIGSLGDGVIYAAAPGAAEAGYFIAPGTDGLQRVLGVLADEAAQTLWVCSSEPIVGTKTGIASALFAFDLKTTRARAQYTLPTPGSLCNDIAVASNGDVYVTDSNNMQVLRLGRGSAKLEIWAGNGAFGPKDGVVDGIAIVDGAVLVNTWRSGRLFRVDFTANGSAGKITEVSVGRKLDTPDGMRRFGEHSMLLIESGEPGRLVRVDVTGNTAKLTTLREGFPGGPVALTVVGETAYVLEGQLKLYLYPKHGDPAPSPFRAFAVPVGKP